MWHGINKQVGAWAKACIACQTSKVHQHVKAPLSTFKVPSRRFDHINVDLLGSLPPSQGYLTSSLLLIDSPAGQKLYRCQIYLLAHVLGH